MLIIMQYSQIDYSNIAINMRKFGGSFVKHLGTALGYADLTNKEKLAKAFPEYFDKYLKWNDQ